MNETIEIGAMRASAMSRIMPCNGSAILCGGEESRSSTDASEGTAAHTLLEYCLRFDDDPSRYLGCEIGADGVKFKVNEEMIDAVETFLTWRSATIPEDAEEWFERKVSMTDIALSQISGHVDYSAYSPSQKKLFICDFKYGIGITVDIEDNKQLMTYAWMTWSKLNDEMKSISISIVQPRTRDDLPVKTKEVSPNDMVQHGIDVFKTAASVEDMLDGSKPIELNVGDHCQFCPAKVKCPNFSEPTREIALNDDTGFIDQLSDDELGYWYLKTKQIKQWLEAIGKRAYERANDGHSVAGVKLVESRGNRQWNVDEEEIDRRMRILGFTQTEIRTEPKIKSPAQMEKLKLHDEDNRKILKQEVAAMVHKPKKAPSLVSIDDKRPAIEKNVVDMFDDEEA